MGALVANLHTKSQGTSQAFGSPGPCFDGLLCCLNGWESKWPTLFAKMLAQVYHYDCLTNGIWDELHAAFVPIIQSVIPRLLNQLETEGREIQPCFIHGDLWDGNLGVAPDGKVYLFDSNGYYAHHEMEFAYWRTLHHRMHEEDYCGAYARYKAPSEPASEFEHRVLLYTMKPLLLFSALYPGDVTRQR